MKIAVTATEPSLDGTVDPRFGRCPFFLVVETDDGSWEPVANPNVTLGGGAGVQSAQLMAEKGVQFVLTGNCGPNAYQTLGAAGIGVIVGCAGRVADVVEQFKAGQLEPAGQPNVATHFGTAPEGGMPGSQPAPPAQPPMPGGATGMGTGPGGGGGMGMGRGMGRGGGGGGGRGGGRGRGMGGGGRGGGRGRTG